MHIEEQFEKLLFRMYPPRVTVDNTSDDNATLIKVDSSNKHGILLEVVQALTDLNLNIRKAYISSDGQWFMDVFYVVDQHGGKLRDGELIDQIQQTLEAREFTLRLRRFVVDAQPEAKHTFIELTGGDRPGLLSEICAVLTNLKCNVVASVVWTHNSRMASILYITDEVSGLPIDDPERLNEIKHVLRNVLKLHRDRHGLAKTASMISVDGTHTERRLHQMLYEARDYDMMRSRGEDKEAVVTIEHYADRFYSIVNVRCQNRPKLLFDAVCTLTDMKYVILHGIITCDGSEANQEYYIRHLDGCPVSCEAERQRIIQCLEAAIKRRSYEGIKLEVCGEDRVGLLSDAARIFREHGLTVTQAEVRNRGTQSVGVFYVADPSGNPVSSQTIGVVRNEIRNSVLLTVKEDDDPESSAQEGVKFSLGGMIRSSSEKLLYNLGLFTSWNYEL